MSLNPKQFVPELRFPEFVDVWKKVELKDVITYTKGYAFKSKNYISEGIRVIRVSDLGANEIKNTNSNIYINPERESEFLKYKLFKNEIIITTVGSKPDLIDSSVGRGIFINNENIGFLNQNMLKINLNSNISNKFLSGFINTPKYFNHINNIKRGNANQANITVVDLLKYRLFIPQLPEQQKIATFLTSVDTKINHLTKKKYLLEQYKKGIMQKIFNQELRFKDANGNDYADWESKTLGEIANIVGGGTPETSKNEYWNGDIQWFTPTEIKFDYVENSRRTITELGLKKSSAKILPKGTLLLTTRATIGEVSIALNECSTNQGFQSLIVKKGINNVFVYNWIKMNKHQLVKRANGSTFPEISKSEIEKISISISYLEEQTKIANFLSTIDDKINHVTNQLEQTNTFKKGLLQKMFV